MAGWYRFLALSQHPLARTARRTYRGIGTFSIPAPRVVFRPLLALYLGVSAVVKFVRRVLIAEPVFKTYCTRYGKRLHTSIQLPWVLGKGRLIVGDDVYIGGKVDIYFAARFSEEPTLEIGDRTGIGHACSFTMGKGIRIGRDCRIAQGVWMFDSPGHPADPELRRAGLPPAPEDVKPITIGDNVWIGTDAIIGPGVTIGDGAVISAASVVMTSVAAYTVVMGNPARRVAALRAPGSDADAAPPPAPATAGAVAGR